MRFTTSQDLRESRLLRHLLLFFFVQGVFFQALSIFFENTRWGWVPQEIKNKILGNEEFFLRPMSVEDLVTALHTEIFLYLFLQTMLLLVFLRTRASDAQKSLACVWVLFSLFLNELSPLLIRYVSENFVFAKIISFWALNLGLIVLTTANIAFLLRKKNA